MKKIFPLILLLTITIHTAFAQKDVQAKKILNAVSLKYKSYDAVRAEFTFKIEDQLAGIKDSETGTLIARPKADKFKMTIYDAGSKTEVAQEIISDGKSQWTYQKKTKETELNDVDHSEGNLNPAQLFTVYEHGYKYVYTGDENLNGKTCQVIELSPEDDKKQFFKIRLWIDKAKKQLYRALIFDKSGSRYTYTIQSFAPNVKISESVFTYDKKDHPGVEVVDLR